MDIGTDNEQDLTAGAAEPGGFAVTQPKAYLVTLVCPEWEANLEEPHFGLDESCALCPCLMVASAPARTAVIKASGFLATPSQRNYIKLRLTRARQLRHAKLAVESSGSRHPA